MSKETFYDDQADRVKRANAAPYKKQVLPSNGPPYRYDICTCHACIERYNWRDILGQPLNIGRSIVCEICGNKRCPHASNHEFRCTGSNAPGQPGSIYYAAEIKAQRPRGNRAVALIVAALGAACAIGMLAAIWHAQGLW